jgi:hypothetical protein
LSFSRVGIDDSIHMRGDHHTIITVNNLGTMIVTTPTMMMMISIIHLVLVFVDLLRLMLGRFLYPSIWILLVRDGILDLLMLGRRRVEVSRPSQLMEETRIQSSPLRILEPGSKPYMGNTTLAIHRLQQRRLQQRLLRTQIPNISIRSMK